MLRCLPHRRSSFIAWPVRCCRGGSAVPSRRRRRRSRSRDSRVEECVSTFDIVRGCRLAGVESWSLLVAEETDPVATRRWTERRSCADAHLKESAFQLAERARIASRTASKEAICQSVVSMYSSTPSPVCSRAPITASSLRSIASIHRSAGSRTPLGSVRYVPQPRRAHRREGQRHGPVPRRTARSWRGGYCPLELSDHAKRVHMKRESPADVPERSS